MRDYNQSLQKNNRRRKTKIFISVVLVFTTLVTSGSVYLIYFTNIFRFNEIVLSGGSQLTIADLFPKLNKPYLFEDIYIKNILVSDFTVKKDIFNKKLNIVIDERKPYGIWCNEDNLLNKKIDKLVLSSSSSSEVASTSALEVSVISELDTECFWFDSTGIIFEKAPATFGVLIKSLHDSGGRKLVVGDTVLPKAMNDVMFKIFDILDRTDVDIISFDLPNLKLQELRAILSKKTVIYFSLRIDPDSIFDVLQSLKPKLNELEYVDLRSENKVFYK